MHSRLAALPRRQMEGPNLGWPGCFLLLLGCPKFPWLSLQHPQYSLIPLMRNWGNKRFLPISLGENGWTWMNMDDNGWTCQEWIKIATYRDKHWLRNTKRDPEIFWCPKGDWRHPEPSLSQESPGLGSGPGSASRHGNFSEFGTRGQRGDLYINFILYTSVCILYL